MLAYCRAHLSNNSHTPKQHLTPVDILLDSKLWAKVFKEMPAASVLWVKKNKGKSSTKFQLKDLCVIRIAVEKVQKGFSRAIWHDGGRSIDYTIYRERGVEAVIESGILKCLVKEGLLPAYVLYNGVRLIEEKAESPTASLSSSEKGFVYLIPRWSGNSSLPTLRASSLSAAKIGVTAMPSGRSAITSNSRLNSFSG